MCTGRHFPFQPRHKALIGGATFQPTLDIVLVGVDLTHSGAFANDEQIIQALINGNQLAV